MKNCNFDIQIVIKTEKENISKNIKKIQEQIKKEKIFNNKNIIEISEKYINFLNKKIKENLSSTKKFYIIFSSKKSQEKKIEDCKKELLEKYYKIKEALSKCGNLVQEIESKNELEILIKEFF